MSENYAPGVAIFSLPAGNIGITEHNPETMLARINQFYDQTNQNIQRTHINGMRY